MDLGDSVHRPATRAEAVGTRPEVPPKIGSNTSFRAAWTTLSRTVGIPSRRSLPPAIRDKIAPARAPGPERSLKGRPKIFPQLGKESVLPADRADVVGRLPIHTRCPRAPVPSHAFPRHEQERGIKRRG